MTGELQSLPQVDELIRSSGIGPALGHPLAAAVVREAIGAARVAAQRGEPVDPAAVLDDARARAGEFRRALLGRVINATGVILHTNIGRAPLAPAAVAAMREASGSTNLELDLESGERGTRAPAAARLVCALAGAEAAHVVNNNAAALVLALAALARGREVIVSRGELIEIGGEFRLPAIMEASGAVLREVGTTNRTRASDVRAALSERTALILQVHPSNYRIVGFTDEATLPEIAAVAREAGVPVLHDTGSGLLVPDERLPSEPDAASSLRAGADLVCFSGDKLLGGPQAGILAGKASLVHACRRHPLARALRADKATLAGLEATLLLHARGTRDTDIPAWRMLSMPEAEIRTRADRLARSIGGTLVGGESVVGGGSMPGHALPTVLVAVPGDALVLARTLRAADPPVVARIQDGALVLDLRTVDPADDDLLARALGRR